MSSNANGTTDEEMIRNIGWCGVIVAVVALGIAAVANSVA